MPGKSIEAADDHADFRITASRVDCAHACPRPWLDRDAPGALVATAGAATQRCGSLGQANANLDQALRDCNRAYGLRGISFGSSKAKWPPSRGASLLSTRSLIDLRQGNLTGAIDDDDAATKLEPGDAYALYTRARSRSTLAKLGGKHGRF